MRASLLIIPVPEDQRQVLQAGVTDVASLAGRQQVVQAASLLPPGELATAPARASSPWGRASRLPAVEQCLGAGVLGGPSHSPG